MPTVVITDHVFPSLAIEQELLGAIGATVVPLQARSEVDCSMPLWMPMRYWFVMRLSPTA